MNPEKKKLMIVGTLFVLMLGIGAFQFMGGSEPAAPQATAEKKTDTTQGDGKTDSTDKLAQANGVYANDKTDEAKSLIEGRGGESDPLRKLYAMKLPVRDPFMMTNAVKAPAVQQPVSQPKPSRPNSDFGKPIGLPPFPIDKSGLPGTNGVGLAPANDPNAFSYTLSGLIEGAKSAAVMTDSEGNQRLIPVGGSLDGDTRVVSISNGKVVVKHRGKNITLTMGGQPDAK